VRKRNSANDRSFAVLGITKGEESIYRCLLREGAATAQAVAKAMHLQPRVAQRMLESIASKGMVTHTLERPRRYIPASPSIAFQSLVLQRQKELQQVQFAVEQLQDDMARQHPEGEHILELITSREAERQIFEQMQLTAKQEFFALIRAPMRISAIGDPRVQDTQKKAQEGGVTYRGIVDWEFLGLPHAVSHVRADIATGEDIRVISQLPFKMVLADRNLALVPLNLHQPDSPALLVRSSALLDALFVLFDMLWERAAPITFKPDGELQADKQGGAVVRDADDVLQLMAAGLNDKAIAVELGLSMRTLNRRIMTLMSALDARTRFQLGARATAHLRPTSPKFDARKKRK
jgi:Mn-dependent DtxR family transcriptional regulator